MQLQLPDKTHSRWISPREAQAMLDKGDAIHVRRRAHQRFEIMRLRPEAMPSKSRESVACLTAVDTQKIAGTIEAKKSERLWLEQKLEHFKGSQLPVVLANFSS